MPGEGMHMNEVRRFKPMQAMPSLVRTHGAWDAQQTPALGERISP